MKPDPIRVGDIVYAGGNRRPLRVLAVRRMTATVKYTTGGDHHTDPQKFIVQKSVLRREPAVIIYQ